MFRNFLFENDPHFAAQHIENVSLVLDHEKYENECNKAQIMFCKRWQNRFVT